MPADELWEDVDRLLERLTPELAAEHGLGPLAARRLRRAGEDMPDRLLREERAGRTASLVAPTLLTRAREAYDGPLLEGPLVVVIRETRLRPKSHFGVKGLNAKGRASEAPTTRPDCLKIARGVEDALTGVLWHDDSQIVAEMLVKAWAGPGERERTQVVVRTFAEMDDEIYEAGMPALRLVCDDGTEVTR